MGKQPTVTAVVDQAVATEQQAVVVPAQRESEPATPRRPQLTQRELQVPTGMADGKNNAEIGRELFVSEDTVKTRAPPERSSGRLFSPRSR